MASAQCDPITLSSEIECVACISGERNLEAVKTWLIAQVANSHLTPAQLVTAMTAAGYNKFSLKQCWTITIYLLCLQVSANDSCTPAGLNAASVAYQKFSWRQTQAAIIYLIASGLNLTENANTFLSSAVAAGWQRYPVKTLWQVQVYLLVLTVLGAAVPANTLATDAACFQCQGKAILSAIEVYLWCQWNIFFLV
jgi:hypothetical protein